jgi:methenyltetrahydromethanopterin cyclohydrolase
MDTVMTGLRMNELAWEIAERMAGQEDRLRVKLSTLPAGARVIDAGVEVPGGFGAGLVLSEICMGGLGTISYTPLHIG